MKFLPRSSQWSLAIGLFASVAACGGNFVPGEGDDAGSDSSDGGSDEAATGGGAPSDAGAGGSTGGASSGGASTGGASTGGATSGSGGEPPQCCTADATCNGFDQQLESEGDCPVGANCYSNTICCSTVWCMEEQPACDAIPVCLEGETEVSECPEKATCTQRALCGTIITCQKVGVDCDRDAEPDRHYVAESPDTCAVIDFVCPEFTLGFSNDCGCGCEQPSECPDSVDCMPGGNPDPLCASEECPYTVRAQ